MFPDLSDAPHGAMSVREPPLEAVLLAQLQQERGLSALERPDPTTTIDASKWRSAAHLPSCTQRRSTVLQNDDSRRAASHDQRAAETRVRITKDYDVGRRQRSEVPDGKRPYLAGGTQQIGELCVGSPRTEYSDGARRESARRESFCQGQGLELRGHQRDRAHRVTPCASAAPRQLRRRRRRGSSSPGYTRLTPSPIDCSMILMSRTRVSRPCGSRDAA